MALRKILDTNSNKRTTIFCGVVVVFLGIIIVQQARILHLKNDTQAIITREQGGKYKFTNPILDFELSATSSESIISSNDARKFVENIQQQADVDHISVYFRDLNNGPWIGINEKEYFTPASMLKTPLLIALYKWSEGTPLVLSKTVIAEERFFSGIPDQINSEPTDIKIGQPYSLDVLAEKMVQNSDNVATGMLYEHIPKEFIDNTFLNIGVVRVNQENEIYLRIKDMASFYRILFNASYLNREHSEAVLKILSETNYHDGLVAGVPKNTKVAHKYGERFPADFKNIKENTIQLHDCGIVYHPKAPYILCVMTRGNDFQKQQAIIKQISHFFYEKISEDQRLNNS